MNQRKYLSEDSMKTVVESGYRFVGEMNTVVHCHHYNSRLQRTIENSQVVDGSRIFSRTAEAVFYKQIKKLLEIKKLPKTALLECAQELYAYQGFGQLDFNQLRVGRVTSSSSHFVNGWNVGHAKEGRKVCSFTEGYIAAVQRLFSGEPAEVRETQCMSEGAEECVFEVSCSTEQPLSYESISYNENANAKMLPEAVVSQNVDMIAVRNAVFGMPIFGNTEGLIPAFNVYLAHMPKDFYNIVSLLFLNEMEKQGMDEMGMYLLELDAETCAMNTFSGIMNSDEWSALIQPMIKSVEDNMFGLVAVANALGWGSMEISQLKPWESMQIQSINGYEAEGLIVDGKQLNSKCPMLTGVTAGLMALVFGDGEFNSRMGMFKTVEDLCLSKGDAFCNFETQAASKKREIA